jgi:hypothetical protein
MEKVYFDDTTFIWKGKLNLSAHKDIILKEANDVADSLKETVRTDGFGYRQEWTNNIDFNGNLTIENKLDEICQHGIDVCKSIYEEQFNIEYNKVNTDAWVNVVRSKNPVQYQFKHEEIKGIDKYHTHTEINKKNKYFYPNYTYVYYIQMPDVMEGEDGVLYFRGENGNEYWIRPEEDDIIVMEGWMPHAPNNAPKSTIDRVVLAGNVGFEFIKKEKSLL